MLCFPLLLKAQKDTSAYGRFSGGMQFGGQGIVMLRFDYFFIREKYVLAGATAASGLNEFSDGEEGIPPVYALGTGLICLAGSRSVFADAELTPFFYHFRSNTFVNLNGWAGLSYMSSRSGIYIGAGWTPRIYYTHGSSDYNNIFIGVKAGMNF